MKSSNCLVGTIHQNKQRILNRVEICGNKTIYQDNGTLFDRFQICKSQFQVLTMQTRDLPSAARFRKKNKRKNINLRQLVHFLLLNEDYLKCLDLPTSGDLRAPLWLFAHQRKSKEWLKRRPDATPLISGPIVHLCHPFHGLHLGKPKINSHSRPTTANIPVPSACLSWLYAPISSSHHVNIPTANISL